jgi:phosphate transport system substrate-binding protein
MTQFLAVVLVLAGASGAGLPSLEINGAGATTPYPIYAKWFAEYGNLHPDVRINYQAIGSGGGIRQLLSGKAFFAATDGPMTMEQMAAMPGGVLHLPTVLGAVVPIYNLPNHPNMRFSGTTLADILLGKVTKWNDPAIAAANPGVPLPAYDIKPVHRSDGSGTTYVLTDYLAKVSPEFKARVGAQTLVNWPVNYGLSKCCEGVEGQVSQIPGAIGFTSLTHARENKMEYGTVKNYDGEFVKASMESLTAAAAAAVPYLRTEAHDFRISITNAPGKGAYPIASFTWLLLPRRPNDTRRARVMVDFVRWALTDGQKLAPELGYAPLPDGVVQLGIETLDLASP